MIQYCLNKEKNLSKVRFDDLYPTVNLWYTYGCPYESDRYTIDLFFG